MSGEGLGGGPSLFDRRIWKYRVIRPEMFNVLWTDIIQVKFVPEWKSPASLNTVFRSVDWFLDFVFIAGHIIQ